jgi:hypothetical protein
MLHLASQGCVVGRGGGCFLSSFIVLVVSPWLSLSCCVVSAVLSATLLLNEKTREVVFEKKKSPIQLNSVLSARWSTPAGLAISPTTSATAAQGILDYPDG